MSAAECYLDSEEYDVSNEFYELATEIFKKYLPAEADGLAQGMIC